MSRVAASILALAVAFCFTFSVGCSDKKGEKKDGKTPAGTDAKAFAPEDTSIDLKPGSDKVVKVKNGEVSSATVDPASDKSKVTATPESDKKGVKIAAAADAPEGKVTVTLKSADNKTTTVNVNVKK